jgi:hypothetical protein
MTWLDKTDATKEKLGVCFAPVVFPAEKPWSCSKGDFNFELDLRVLHSDLRIP